MKRWHAKLGSTGEQEFPAVDAFIEDVIAVYRKHGLTIAHEDGHGAFIIEGLDEHNERWLRDAMAGEMLEPKEANA